MKVKTYYYIAPLLMLLSLLSYSCDSPGDCDTVPTAPQLGGTLKVAENNIQLLEGERRLLAIAGGSGEYTTHIANVGVATAHPAKGGIELHGIKSGEETLIIKDVATGEKQEVTLTIVKEYSLTATPNSTLLYPSSSKIIYVTGGSGEYTTSLSATDIIEVVEQTKGKIVVRALKQGSTELTVTDTKHQVSTIIPLSVELRPLVLSKEELTLRYGQHETIRIKKGNGSYEVEVPTTSPALLKTTLKETAIEVEAIGIGEASFIVKDVVSGETKEVKVNIPPSDLELATQNVVMPSTGTFYLPITMGNGQYEVTVAEEAKDKLTATIEKGLIKLVSTAAVTGTITVKDTHTSQTKEAAVTARELKQNPDFDKNELTITAKGAKGYINLPSNYGKSDYYYWRPEYDENLLLVEHHFGKRPIFSIFGHKPGSTIVTIKNAVNRQLVAEVLVTVVAAQ